MKRNLQTPPELQELFEERKKLSPKENYFDGVLPQFHRTLQKEILEEKSFLELFKERLVEVLRMWRYSRVAWSSASVFATVMLAVGSVYLVDFLPSSSAVVSKTPKVEYAVVSVASGKNSSVSLEKGEDVVGSPPNALTMVSF